MPAIDRLHAARRAAFEGRHEEALSEFVWFHDHALEEDLALSGVRLSFALMYWMELAKVYPKARQALEEIRDKKESALIHDERNRETFQDVVAINEALACPARTHSLFVRLAASNPSLAETCADIALSAIAEAGDYQLAFRYLPEPDRRINELAQSLNQDIADLKQYPRQSHAKLRNAFIRIYESEVKLISSILSSAGQPDEAARLVSLAVKQVKSPSIRKAVRSALEAKA